MSILIRLTIASTLISSGILFYALLTYPTEEDDSRIAEVMLYFCTILIATSYQFIININKLAYFDFVYQVTVDIYLIIFHTDLNIRQGKDGYNLIRTPPHPLPIILVHLLSIVAHTIIYIYAIMAKKAVKGSIAVDSSFLIDEDQDWELHHRIRIDRMTIIV